MKKRLNRDRFIALLMAVVMLLSLVVFENRFGTKAEGGSEIDTDTVSISSLISGLNVGDLENISIDKNSSKIKAYKNATEVTLSNGEGQYYIKDIGKEAVSAKNNIASTSDAAGYESWTGDQAGLIPVENASIISLDDTKDTVVYAVYSYDSDVSEFKLRGFVIFIYDGEAPTGDVELASTGDVKAADSGAEYDYLVRKGQSAKYTLSVNDPEGDGAISGISKVVAVDGSDEMELAETSGNYTYKVTKPGTYKFKAYDNAGNTSIIGSETGTTFAFSNGIEINSIKTSYDKTVTLADSYLANDEKFTVTVEASEETTSGDEMGLKLNYFLIPEGGAPGPINSVNFAEGKATTPALPDSSRVKLVMYITDIYGEEGKTYAFDENGFIVFCDDSAPNVIIDEISLSKDGILICGDLDTYNSLTSKWAKKVYMDLSAKEVDSYLKKLYYVLDGEDTTVIYDIADDTAAYTAQKSVEFTENGEHTVVLYGTNVAGAGDSKSIDLYIDGTAPEVSINSNGTKKEDGAFQVLSGAAQISVTPSDEQSGIASTIIKVNGVKLEPEDYEASEGVYTFQLPEAGNYVISAETIDKAGNKATDEKKVIVDNKEPAISLQILNASNEDITEEILSGETYLGGNSLPCKVIYTVESLNITADDISDLSVVGNLDITSDAVVVEETGKVTITYTLSSTMTNGKYSFDIKAKKHGATADTENYKSEEKASFVLDSKAPGDIVVAFSGQKSKIDDVYYYAESSNGVVIAITATDNYNLEKYVIYKDGDESTPIGSSTENPVKSSGAEKKITVPISSLTKNTDYTIAVYVTDKAGNTSDKTVKGTFRVDTVNPENTIQTDLSEKYYSAAQKKIAVKGSDDKYVASIQCIDSTTNKVMETIKNEDNTSDFTGTFTFTDKKHYKLKFVAVDEVGNKSEESEADFYLDVKAPTISQLDTSKGAADTEDIVNNYYYNHDVKYKADILDDLYIDKDCDVKITKKVETWNGMTNSLDLVGGSAGNENLVEKSTTNIYTKAGMADCSQYSGQAAKYTFSVTAADKAGNMSKTNTVAFYVDKTAPAKIGSGYELEKSSRDNYYYNGPVTYKVKFKEQYKGATITITNKVTGEVLSTYTTGEQSPDGNYQKAFTVKQEGKYQLQVDIVDKAGNKISSDSIKIPTFYVDYTKPTVSIAQVAERNNTNVTINTNVSDNFAGESLELTVSRKSSGGAVSTVVKNYTWKGDSQSFSYAISEEGDYEVTAVSTDQAGLNSATAKTSFRIDKTAPTLSITGVNDTQTTGATATLSINEAFTFSKDGNNGSTDVNVTITKKSDGQGVTTIATLNYGNFHGSSPLTASYNFSEDGIYNITFSATDYCGNKATTVTKEFKVDKTAPVVTATTLDKGNNKVEPYSVIGSQSGEESNFVKLSLSVQETFFASDAISIKITKDNVDVTSDYFKGFNGKSGVKSNFSQIFREDGSYKVTISAKDALGNKSNTYETTFTVDNTDPIITASSTLKAFNSKEKNGVILLNKSDIDPIVNDGYEAIWDVEETNPKYTNVKLDGVDFVDFSDISDGTHTMEITVEDRVGHVKTDSFTFTYDGTAPRILVAGIDDGESTDEPFTLKISLEDEEDNIDSAEVLLDGKAVSPSASVEGKSYEYQIEEYGNYEVRVLASDDAGNTSATYDEAEDYVYSFKVAAKVSALTLIIIIAAALVLIGLLLLLILRKKRKNKER